MTVNAKGVYIAGDNETGVFYGIQTLMQLLPVEKSKFIIHSLCNHQRFSPFSIPWYDLDVGRHFFPVVL